MGAQVLLESHWGAMEEQEVGWKSQSNQNILCELSIWVECGFHVDFSGGTGGLGGSGESSEDEREGRIRVGRDYQAIIQLGYYRAIVQLAIIRQ